MHLSSFNILVVSLVIMRDPDNFPDGVLADSRSVGDNIANVTNVFVQNDIVHDSIRVPVAEGAPYALFRWTHP
jgi:hypothetical protein